jgi:hypothetical protein
LLSGTPVLTEASLRVVSARLSGTSLSGILMPADAAFGRNFFTARSPVPFKFKKNQRTSLLRSSPPRTRALL